MQNTDRTKHGNVVPNRVALYLFHTYKIVEECLVISNYNGDYGGIPIDGEYRRLNERFFVKNDICLIEGETLMLIKQPNGNQWSGCKGNIRAFENKYCPNGKRFAYFSDITKPKVGNVNIWSKKGDSSGTLQGKCGQHGMIFMEDSYSP